MPAKYPSVRAGLEVGDEFGLHLPGIVGCHAELQPRDQVLGDEVAPGIELPSIDVIQPGLRLLVVFDDHRAHQDQPVDEMGREDRKLAGTTSGNDSRPGASSAAKPATPTLRTVSGTVTNAASWVT